MQYYVAIAIPTVKRLKISNPQLFNRPTRFQVVLARQLAICSFIREAIAICGQTKNISVK